MKLCSNAISQSASGGTQTASIHVNHAGVTLRGFLVFLLFFLWASIGRVNAQVSLTATGGTLSGSFGTLKAAFDAINAGTHTGDIVINISANTTESTTPCVLNSSGAGSASYTTLLIQPSNDGVTISGATVTGRGLIELNGADNVTINGDNPNTGGTNRNLTITNTAAATVTFTSAIRIALATSQVTTANNVSIQNCNINGSGAGLNISSNTGTGTSVNNTYGIYLGGGASTVAQTTAPSAIASLTTVIGSVATANGFTVNNNVINACGRGIAVQGSYTGFINSLTVTNNTIGASSSSSTTTVYTRGMTLQGFTAATITGNTVRNINSWLGDFVAGISLGDISATGAAALVANNSIVTVNNQSTGTFGAYGLNILGGSGAHTIRNNFVAGVTGTITGGAAFSTTFGVFGIRVGGTSSAGHKFYHNSVSLSGVRTGTATSSLLSASFAVIASTVTGLDIRNNIFSNTQSGGTTSLSYVSMYLPSGLTSAINHTINNNAYFCGTTAASQGIAQVGLTAGSGFYLPGNFNAAVNTPSTNLRAYTSTLSVAATNDNASLASSSAVPFASATDLHIAPTNPAGIATATLLKGTGANLGVTTDFDGQTRSVSTPDLGADEFNLYPSFTHTALGNTCVTSDRTVTADITDPNGGGIVASNLYYRKNAGSYVTATGTLTSGTANSGTWTYTISSSALGGLTTGDQVSYYIVAEGSSANVNSTPPVYIGTSVSIGTFTGTPNSYSITTSLSGNYNVGSGGDFATLTAAVTAYNTACLTGAVTFTLTDGSYPSETLPITILSNPDASNSNTLTIKPAASTTVTLSGSNANAIIRLNGADYVTIDGSNNGSDSRDLTIQNSNTAGSSIVWIGSVSASDGATNNTIKNCNIQGTANTVIGGILAGSALTLGGAADAPNNNNTIHNNVIKTVQNGIYNSGYAATNDQNWVITNNVIGSTVTAEKLLFRGMIVISMQNVTISGNTILGVSSTTTSTSTMHGIQISGALNGGTITKNKITDIRQNNTTGYAAAGITLGSSSTNANLLVSNNFISDVSAVGNSTAATNGHGIYAISGGGYNIYHNSVNQTVSQTSGVSSAIYLGAGLSASSVDLRNNIFSNRQTAGGTRYAIYSDAPNTVLSNIDYNDYYCAAANSLGYIGSTVRTNLAGIQAGFGGNANSTDFQPLFTSNSDLLLTSPNNAPLNDLGTPIAAVTVDIENEARSGSTPDIGADEFTPPPCDASDPGTLNNTNFTICEGQSAVINSTGASVGLGVTYQWQWSTNAGGPYNNVTNTEGSGGTTVSFTTNPLLAPGTYYLVLLVNCSETGSTLSDEVTLVVNPAPSLGVTPGSGLICNPGGAAVALTATGADTYVWTPNSTITPDNVSASVSVLPTSTTTYSVVGTLTATGCTKTLQVPITVSSTPTTSISANPSAAVCSGSNVILDANASLPAFTYCTSTHSNGCSLGDEITNVTVNTLNNSSACSSGAYILYTGGGTQTTTLTAGSTYSYAVTLGSDGSQYAGAWIDFDQDGTLSASEFLGASGNAGAGGTVSVSFTVPVNALNGTTRLRVIAGNDAALLASQACGASSSTYGETEDYNITIAGGSPKFTYVWSPADFLSSTTTSPTTAVNVTADKTYSVTVTSYLGCPANSAPFPVTVNQVPTAPNIETGTSVQCGPGVPTVAVSSTSGAPTPIFRWRDALNPTVVLQESTSATYTSSVPASINFLVSEWSGTCESGTVSVSVTVNTPPTLQITPGSSTTYCAGGTVTLDAGAAPTSNTYTTFTWTGAGLNAYNVASVSTLTNLAAGPYTFQVTASEPVAPGSCTATASVNVTINANPVIDSLKANFTTICSGSTSTLNVYSASIVTGPQTEPTGYAASSANNTTDEEILNVTFGSLNNSSTCATLAGGSGSIQNRYSNYTTTVTAPTVMAGASVPFSVQIGTCDDDFDNWTNIYIDWNRNGIFEVGEKAYTSVATTTGPHTESGTIQVPQNATAGVTRMRVFVVEFGSASSSPNATYGWGETEDYIINVLGVVQQNPSLSYTWNETAPNAGVVAGPTVGGFTYTTAALTATTSYTVTLTDANNCTVTSTPATQITVSEAETVSISNVSVNPICNGQSTTLTATASGGGVLTYVWTDLSDNSTVGGNSPTLTVSPSSTRTYRVTVTDECISSPAATAEQEITVNQIPATPTVSGGGTFCSTSVPIFLNASNGNDGTIYYQGVTLNGTSNANATSSASISTLGTYYFSALSAENCWSPTGSATVIIQQAPSITPTNATICAGSSGNMSASSSCPGFSITNSISGAWNAGTDPIALRPESLANSATCSFNSSVTRNYSVKTFQVSTAGTYTFAMDQNAAYDGMGYLTSGAFTPGSCETGTFIKGDDDSNGGLEPAFTASLVPNVTYSLYSLTFSASVGTFSGSYNWTVTPPLGGTLYVDGNGTIEWYATSSGGAVLGTGNNFNPIGVLGSGLPDSETPGLYTFYAACSNSNSCRVPVTLTITARPTAVISGDAIYPTPTATDLSIAVTGTGPWSGTILPGNIPFSGSSSPITVSVTPSNTTVYTLGTLTDNGTTCVSTGADLSGSATVTIVTLSAPSVSVTQPTCAVATGTITVTSPVIGGYQYSIDGSNYQLSNVFPNQLPGSYNVTFKDLNNFTSPIAVATVDPQPFTPGTPVITGPYNVCQYVGTNTPVTYTATATGNGTQTFNWILPPNTTVVSGQGTNTLVVTFPNPAFLTQANKQLRLTVTNACGTSPLTIHYLQAQTPSTPLPIVASTANVCPSLGTNVPITYTIPKVAGASSYIWNAQSGTTTITHPNGLGENDTTVTVTFTAGFTTSNITVQALNSCGTSASGRSLTITRANPATPGLINGPVNVCANIAPGGTPATYSVAQQPTATSYNWTLPGGAIGVVGQGTNTISFTYPTGYTGGSISVVAINGCGTSSSRSLAVSKLSPATPSVIDVVQTDVCPNRVYTYSLASMPANATTVNWTYPAGGSVVNQSAYSISIHYPILAITGTVTAQAVNSCGSSVIRSTSVFLPACPPEEKAPVYSKGNTPTAPVELFEAQVFPNPTVSDFKLRVKSLDKNSQVTVRVLDLQGRELSRMIVMPDALKAFGSNLKAGAYFVEVLQGDKRTMQKLIKL